MMESETFFGQGLERPVMDALALRLVPEARAGEAQAWSKRWFDHRHLHPVEATYLFAHLYAKQTRAYYAKCVDERTADEARPFTPVDIFWSRDMTAMWMARQTADMHGIPYGFALQFAESRSFDRLMRCFPRPNQLYGEEYEADLLAAWQARVDRGLVFSELDRFKVHARCGDPAQLEHVEFLLGQIRRRGSSPGLMARCLNAQVLSREEVAHAFGEAALAEAQRKAALIG